VFYAEQKDSIVLDQPNASVSPYFIVIVSCINNLTLNAGGSLTCEGETEVQQGLHLSFNNTTADGAQLKHGVMQIVRLFIQVQTGM